MTDTSKMHQAALALEASGRFRDAIDAWTALNREQPDTEVEQRLVRLRHEAALQLDASVPVEPWPPVLADPFPDVVGRPPEILGDELTSEVLGGAILHHGCVLVRELVEVDRAHELIGLIDAAFDAREAHLSGASLSQTAPWFAPDPAYDAVGDQALLQRALNRKLNAVIASDSPRALFKLIDALEQNCVPEILAGYFGERPVLSVEKTTLRRVLPGPSPAWHQDGSFLGSGVRTVDVWVALSRCGDGTDASGLEVLPRRLDAILECGIEGTRTGIEVLNDQVQRAGGGIAPVRPTFEPGDALLFDEMFLHRTMPGLPRERYAIEVWTFASSSCAESYVPIAL
ncbi:MAG: hypothetical protein QOH28_1599 [Actinomycetota bacterium]|jgi:hypothetical protein|nr:hypothetical protein [Actinomycetota bacterium]